MVRSLTCRLLAAATIAACLAPAGAATYTVSTVGDLNYRISHAAPNDEIVVTPGTYNLTQYLQLNAAGMTVRGSTGVRDDVVLVGGGMNTNAGVKEGLLVNTDGITISDLTLRDFYHNGIHIRGENDADDCTISNVKTWDIGQRHIKGSGGGGASAVSDDVVIEDVYMLQTTPRADGNHHGNYIGGIDCMGVRNWVIRDCVARGIRGHTDGGNAAIFLWQGVEGVTIERNRIYECVKGIGLGNPADPNGVIFTYPHHATDVVVRNNFVLRGEWTGGNNIGLELCNVEDVDVLNNTFYSEDAGYFRTVSLLDNNGGGANTDVEVVNNIVRGRVWENGGHPESLQQAFRDMGNVVDTAGATVAEAWFDDWASGDFHLTELADGALNGGTVLAGAPEDFDRCGRGNCPDLGADELQYPGDVNLDCVVDVLDLACLANHFGETDAGWLHGDQNGDGAVDVLDLAAIANGFGWAAGGARAGGDAVPAPGALALLAAGLPAIVGRRRKSPRR